MKKSVKILVMIIFALMISLFCDFQTDSVKALNTSIVNQISVSEANHTHDGYTEIDSAISLPIADGTYKLYLTQDIILEDDWEVPEGEVKICLNGNQIITNSHSIVLEDDKTTIDDVPSLIIESCQEDGTITHSGKRSNLFDVYGGKLIINGGEFVSSNNFSSIIYAYSGNIVVNDGDFRCTGNENSFCVNIPYSNSLLDFTIKNGNFLSQNSCAVSIATYSTSQEAGYFSSKTKFKVEKACFKGGISAFDVDYNYLYYNYDDERNFSPIIIPTYEVIKVSDGNSANYFYENGAGFNVYYFDYYIFNNNYKVVEFLGEHIHSFTYAKRSENTIEAVCCSDDTYCVLHHNGTESADKRPTVTIELDGTSPIQYDGEIHKIATLAYDSFSLYNYYDYDYGYYNNIDDIYNLIKNVSIKYTLKGSLIEVDPKNPGIYVASATISGLTISTEFEIFNGYPSSINAKNNLTKEYDNERASVNLNDLVYKIGEDEFSGNNIPSSINITRWFDNDFSELSQAPINVGEYYVEISVDTYNGYSECSAIEPYIITQKIVTVLWEVTSFEFNGNKQYPCPTINFYDGANVGYTLNSDGYITVGEYSIEILSLADSNYALPSNVSTVYEIYRKKIDIPNADNKTFTYNGSSQKYALLEWSGVYSISNNIQSEAGTHVVTVSIVNSNYKWSDDSITDKTYNFVINKKIVSNAPINSTEFRYNGLEQQYYTDFDDTNLLYTVSSNERTEPGTQNVVISLKDPSNYIWSKGSSSDIIYEFKILPKLVERPGEDLTNFVYDGSEKTYSYVENIDANLYEVVGLSNKQVDAGLYKVIVALKDKVKYVWSDTETNADKEYDFFIEKADYVDFPTSVKLLSNAFVENGDTKYSIFISNEADLPDDIIQVSYQNNEKCRPGIYSVTVNFVTSKSNYKNPVSMSATMTIKWAEEELDLDDDLTPEGKFVVSAEEGVYPTYHLNIEKDVDEKEIKESLKNSNAFDESQYTVYKIYDVKLINNFNQNIDFDGNVNVRTSIPSNIADKKFMIFNVNNGEVTKIDFNIIDGELVFSVDDLSQIVFVANYTSLTNWMIALSALMIVFVLVMVCLANSLKKYIKICNKTKKFFAIVPVLYAPLHLESTLILAIITAVLFLINIFLLIILLSVKARKNDKKAKIVQNLSNERVIKDSFELSKVTDKNKAISKKTIVEFLEKNYKENEIEINHRDNFVKNSAILLADTHYVLKKEKGKLKRICFVYVYEREDNSILLLLKLDKKFAIKLGSKHSSIAKSNYPKSNRNETWYSLPIDDSYSTQEVFSILSNLIKGFNS